MTPEEIQQNFEFLLQRQQEIADNMTLLQESQMLFQKQVAEAQAAFDARLLRLSEAALSIFGRLDKSQQETEERLNIFINIVERFISDKQGDKS